MELNKTEIYADTSKIDEIFNLYENTKLITGFTTNPSLMRKAGIVDYTKFIKEVTAKITDLPLSFEIFADELNGMEYQIQKLSEFGENIYVKVPIMNTKGDLTYDLIHKMNNKGIKLNVTAVFTNEQIQQLLTYSLNHTTPSIVSIFSGRIADTGQNPSDYIIYANKHNKNNSVRKVLWASVREVYNIYEAQKVNCDIITITPDIITKYIKFAGKDLHEFSKETVTMFYNDAFSSGLTL